MTICRANQECYFVFDRDGLHEVEAVHDTVVWYLCCWPIHVGASSKSLLLTSTHVSE